MLKKLMVLLTLIALSASAVSAFSVSSKDVILVSDNCADQTAALEIANVLNATVVTTAWGIYNESIVENIKSLNPDKVIIIGGSSAVVDDYVEALNNDGISVERIGGKTRYDTNANITLKFQSKFANTYGNTTICVVHGLDEASLNETATKVKYNHCLVILSNGTNLSVEPTKLHLKINKVEVIENPACPCNNSKVIARLTHKGFNVSVNSIPENKLKMIIQNRIRHMDMKIKMLKRRGIDTTELEVKLNEANELMSQNKYKEAYKTVLQLEGEQMALVKLKLHANGHGHAKLKTNMTLNTETNSSSGAHANGKASVHVKAHAKTNSNANSDNNFTNANANASVSISTNGGMSSSQ
ncbi:cell wall-binding repeat-containing protein [Methanothermococcus okinawensis]|uniref:Cell wall binding repeat 2-containing protein n=1 Tax=Methanothermococcus okinawensis (strain DSM 14208 / JCM 11175 / IH1) TaxID=647113 RepID=F8AJN0_METOI|nr:cell wall-binding repeat 2 family protein [Methanothermococcus okinawensis]AEH07218.1 cell wall binding repeat 2-containing protein [Methanothermococcus okinawensis IH1]